MFQYYTRRRGDKTKFFALIIAAQKTNFLGAKKFSPNFHGTKCWRYCDIAHVTILSMAAKEFNEEDEKKLSELLAKAGLSHLKSAFVREKVR